MERIPSTINLRGPHAFTLTAMGARGACLRIVILTRGASIFFCLAGWDFSGQADFFPNFQEILAQELHQNRGPDLVQNLGSEPGPKMWSKNCTKNLVHVVFV